MEHILETQQFSREWLENTFFPATIQMENALATGTSLTSILDGKQALLLFWEPSSRTVSRFNIAARKLGIGSTIIVGEKGPDGKPILQFSSEAKGESFEDTMRTFAGHGYDYIIIRSPEEGRVARAAEIIDKFNYKTHIINAGDGPGQHPTQALLDLWTIKKDFGQIDGLKCALIGDLKGSRVMHSLAYILSKFDVEMTFMTPEELAMPKRITDHVKKHTGAYCEVEPGDFGGIEDADFWYIVRFQKERHEGKFDYDICINRSLVQSHLKDNGKIYHPLPRKEEIPGYPASDTETIDGLPCAGYFGQVTNGVPVSMTLYEILAHGQKKKMSGPFE